MSGEGEEEGHRRGMGRRAERSGQGRDAKEGMPKKVSGFLHGRFPFSLSPHACNCRLVLLPPLLLLLLMVMVMFLSHSGQC